MDNSPIAYYLGISTLYDDLLTEAQQTD